MFRYWKQFHLARPSSTRWAVLATCVALIAAPPAGAQAPAAAGKAAQEISPDVLMTLVGPIALYPDDLVALILPASTFPLQLVQADRFLAKRKNNPNLKVDDRWDDSVKSLVNYPEVVKKMSEDLDWTTNLGEAVVANQGAVLDAVQAFRRKAYAAGNLKSDQKQVVEMESEVIKIVPADPQVIYVPQYNPATVVTYSSVPVYGYYPSAYPVYYYPYAPGAALATGLIWGAALGAVWSGGHYGASWHGGNNNITVNRNTNVSGNFNRSQTQRTQSTAWRSDKRPGQVSSGGRTASAGLSNARPGDPGRAARTSQGAGDFGGGQRAATQRTGDRGGAARSSTQLAGGAQGSSLGSRDGGSYGSSSGGYSRTGGGSSRDALGGYGSGNAARADSARGASSRSSMMSSGGSRGGFSGGGGRGGGGRGGGGRGR